MNWNGKPVNTTGFAVSLAMLLKMNSCIPPEMTGRSNLGTATYISWNVPPEMGDKCQYHLIWVAALPTVKGTSRLPKWECLLVRSRPGAWMVAAHCDLAFHFMSPRSDERGCPNWFLSLRYQREMMTETANNPAWIVHEYSAWEASEALL